MIGTLRVKFLLTFVRETLVKEKSDQGIHFKARKFNSFHASGNFCHLLITFATSLDPDQA